MTETTIAPRAARGLLAFLREGRGARGGPGRATPGGKKRGWTPTRIVALAMMLFFPIVGIFGASAAHADDDEDVMKYSFYKVASATTAFFSTVQDPGNKQDFSGEWLSVLEDPGSAGGLLGYADPNFSLTSGWLASKLSGSSDAIGYETLRVRGGEDDDSFDSSKYQGMVDYAYFGAALKGMGLDGTSTGLSLGFVNLLAGGVIMLLYVLSGCVDFVFSGILSILANLNPFKLFYLGVSAANPGSEAAAGMVGGQTSVWGPLSGIASMLSGFYQVLESMAWSVMVPIFIGVLLFSLVMFKKLDKGSLIKKIFIRMLFIGLGLPLLGGMYTSMINSMAEASTDGNAGSTRVVMSTYVDFENWALNSRLSVPTGATIAWDPTGAQPTGDAQAKVRNTALAINSRTHNLYLSPIISAGAFDASWSSQIMQDTDANNSTSSRSWSITVDMLVRYMSGAQLSGAAFETAAKGNLSQSTFYTGDNTDTVNGWFEKLQQSAGDLNKLKGDESPAANPLLAVKDGTGLIGSADGAKRVFTSSSTSCTRTGTKIVDNNAEPRACNLSPLAMYNYLNTDFGSTSMTMYSSSNVMSEATRSIHKSVNQVGSGAMSFLYWLNAVVLLGSFVVIGLGYAFGLVIGNIRRTFQIIAAVPFATLGALAAIAKVVVYTLAMLLEVIVTIFVYKLVQEFLTALPQIIEMPFSAILNQQSGGKLVGFVIFLTSGWAFGMVVTLLSIVAVTAFTIMALRLRKSLVKAVEEAVTKLVEKFMDTSPGSAGGGGKMMPALAGGLAAGAGAAASNRMMNGGVQSKGAKPSLPNSTPGEGPGGITSAGGAIPMGPGPDGQGGGAGGVLAVEGDAQLAITDGSQGPRRGADGNEDPGSPLDSSAGAPGASTSDEVELGRSVETNGLSNPEAGETAAPKVGDDDAMSTASKSVDESNEGYKAADRKRVTGAKDGAEAVGHGAVAVGRGVAGDGTGAAESAGKAVEKGGQAAASTHEAKQMEADAGRSSLDKPSNTHAKRAGKAQQVSAMGSQVSGAAGAAGGGGSKGGGAGGTQVAPKGDAPKGVGPKAGQPSVTRSGPQRRPVAPRPAQSGTQRAPQSASKPQTAGSAPAPRQGAAQPSRQGAAPTQQPGPAPQGPAPMPRQVPASPSRQASGKGEDQILGRAFAKIAPHRDETPGPAPAAPKPTRSPRPSN